MRHEKEKTHAQALLHTSHRGVDDTRATGRGGAYLQGIQTKPDYSQRFPCITNCFRCCFDYCSSDTMRDAVAMPRARAEQKRKIPYPAATEQGTRIEGIRFSTYLLYHLQAILTRRIFLCPRYF